MNHIKIYIASSFDLTDEVKSIAKHLERKGYVITRHWWEYGDLKLAERLSPGDPFTKSAMSMAFFANIAAIQDCDIMVFVCDPAMITNFIGANVEIGMATIMGKPIISIGKTGISAMYGNLIKANGITELDELLERFK